MKETIKNHSVKITVGSVIAVVLFIIYTTISITSTKDTISKELDLIRVGQSHIVEMVNDIDRRVDDNEDTGNEVRIKLASIETQLYGINTTLIEIKESIK